MELTAPIHENMTLIGVNDSIATPPRQGKRKGRIASLGVGVTRDQRPETGDRITLSGAICNADAPLIEDKVRRLGWHLIHRGAVPLPLIGEGLSAVEIGARLPIIGRHY